MTTYLYIEEIEAQYDAQFIVDAFKRKGLIINTIILTPWEKDGINYNSVNIKLTNKDCPILSRLYYTDTEYWTIEFTSSNSLTHALNDCDSKVKQLDNKDIIEIAGLNGEIYSIEDAFNRIIELNDAEETATTDEDRNNIEQELIHLENELAIIDAVNNSQNVTRRAHQHLEKYM